MRHASVIASKFVGAELIVQVRCLVDSIVCAQDLQVEYLREGGQILDCGEIEENQKPVDQQSQRTFIAALEQCRSASMAFHCVETL